MFKTDRLYRGTWLFKNWLIFQDALSCKPRSQKDPSVLSYDLCCGIDLLHSLGPSVEATLVSSPSYLWNGDENSEPQSDLVGIKWYLEVLWKGKMISVSFGLYQMWYNFPFKWKWTSNLSLSNSNWTTCWLVVLKYQCESEIASESDYIASSHSIMPWRKVDSPIFSCRFCPPMQMVYEIWWELKTPATFTLLLSNYQIVWDSQELNKKRAFMSSIKVFSSNNYFVYSIK